MEIKTRILKGKPQLKEFDCVCHVCGAEHKVVRDVRLNNPFMVGDKLVRACDKHQPEEVAYAYKRMIGEIKTN